MDAILTTMSLDAFGLMMPKLADVRSAGPNGEIAADVRLGQLASAVVIIGIGAIISYTTKDKTVLYVAIGAVTLLALVYEYALRIDPGKGVH